MDLARFKSATLSRWGRATTIALLLLALWNPPLPLKTAPIDLVMVLDESSSMDQEFIGRSWQQVIRLITTLPPGSHFSLIRFGGNSITEIKAMPADSVTDGALTSMAAPPRTRSIDPNVTDIEQALRNALVQSRPERNNVILLISDGLENRGDLAGILPQTAGFPAKLYWLAPPRPTMEAGPRILSLKAPERILSGQTPRFTVELLGKAGVRRKIEARLDGKPFLEKEILFSGTGPSTLTGRIPATTSGIHVLEASVIGKAGENSSSSTQQSVIQTLGPARVLYLGQRPTESPIATDLKRGGWPVRTTTPATFHSGLLESADVILIEDLPVQSLPESAWQQIETAVTHHGKGLLLLGGPHSFGSGGYRESTLEELLPLIAEPRTPLPTAAVLFLLDKSGSMGRSATPDGKTRMMIARQAVVEAAALLQPEDEVGLMVFDTAPRALLPLARYPDISKQIVQGWKIRPHGGTRLHPALETAIQALAQAETEQRIILLVSDGHIENEQDFATLVPALKEQNIDLVALTIGNVESTPILERLTRINSGHLLPVTEILRLPRLMREEVLKRRTATELSATIPFLEEPLDFLSGFPETWPLLDGYSVTRPRPDAHVHLVSQKGDPLLASRLAGLGRVMALPGGLDQWASRWKAWDHWGLFIGGLVEWVSGYSSNSQLTVRHELTATGVKLIIDVPAGKLTEWETTADLGLRIRGPGGGVTHLKAQLAAPGRYSVHFSPRSGGLHHVYVTHGKQSHHSGFYYRPVNEQDSLDDAPGVLENALEEGLVSPWAPGTPLNPGSNKREYSDTRPGLLLLALLVYLFTLVKERELPLIRARFRTIQRRRKT